MSDKRQMDEKQAYKKKYERSHRQHREKKRQESASGDKPDSGLNSSQYAEGCDSDMRSNPRRNYPDRRRGNRRANQLQTRVFVSSQNPNPGDTCKERHNHQTSRQERFSKDGRVSDHYRRSGRTGGRKQQNQANMSFSPSQESKKPDVLPVCEFKEKILEEIKKNRVVCIHGETGCGKSTMVPQFIMDEAQNTNKGNVSSLAAQLNLRKGAKIIVTQPRRMAAISLAKRVASERGERVGQSVGYQIGGESMLSSYTKLTYVTTGFLLQKLVNNPQSFDNYTHVILDEIHERQIDSDLLSLVVKLYLDQYHYTKIIVMSATLQGELFSRYFADSDQKDNSYSHSESESDSDSEHDQVPPQIFVGARRFPVEDIYIDDLVSSTKYQDWFSADEVFSLANAWVKFNQFYAKRSSEDDVVDQFQHLFEQSLRKVHGVEKAEKKLYNFSSDLKSTPREKTLKATVMAGLIQVCVTLIKKMTTPGETILVFLPGIGEIYSLYDVLAPLESDPPRSMTPIQLFVLHSQIPREDQDACFEAPPATHAHVILATNIAESSLTLPKVRVVIDFGLKRQVMYDDRRRMMCLIGVWCSKASAKQRAGRTGRVFEGKVVRLMAKNYFNESLREFDPPEMETNPLDKLILRVKQLGKKIADGMSVSELLQHAVESPSMDRFVSTVESLADVGALTENSEHGDITLLGHVALKLPLDIILCRLVVYGVLFNCTCDAVVMAAALSIRMDPFTLPNLMIMKDPEKFLKSSTNSFKSRARFDNGQYSEPIMYVNMFKAWMKERVQERGRNAIYSKRVRFCRENALHTQRLIEMENSVCEIASRLNRYLPDKSKALRDVQTLMWVLRSEVDDEDYNYEETLPSGVSKTQTEENDNKENPKSGKRVKEATHGKYRDQRQDTQRKPSMVTTGHTSTMQKEGNPSYEAKCTGSEFEGYETFLNEEGDQKLRKTSFPKPEVDLVPPNLGRQNTDKQHSRHDNEGPNDDVNFDNYKTDCPYRGVDGQVYHVRVDVLQAERESPLIDGNVVGSDSSDEDDEDAQAKQSKDIKMKQLNCSARVKDKSFQNQGARPKQLNRSRTHKRHHLVQSQEGNLTPADVDQLFCSDMVMVKVLQVAAFNPNYIFGTLGQQSPDGRKMTIDKSERAETSIRNTGYDPRSTVIVNNMDRMLADGERDILNKIIRLMCDPKKYEFGIRGSSDRLFLEFEKARDLDQDNPVIHDIPLKAHAMNHYGCGRESFYVQVPKALHNKIRLSEKVTQIKISRPVQPYLLQWQLLTEDVGQPPKCTVDGKSCRVDGMTVLPPDCGGVLATIMLMTFLPQRYSINISVKHRRITTIGFLGQKFPIPADTPIRGESLMLMSEIRQILSELFITPDDFTKIPNSDLDDRIRYLIHTVRSQQRTESTEPYQWVRERRKSSYTRENVSPYAPEDISGEDDDGNERDNHKFMFLKPYNLKNIGQLLNFCIEKIKVMMQTHFTTFKAEEIVKRDEGTSEGDYNEMDSESDD
ncbi:uncharacterized protein LOC144432533 isoform X2 [Glandiceps talaboti]